MYAPNSHEDRLLTGWSSMKAYGRPGRYSHAIKSDIAFWPKSAWAWTKEICVKPGLIAGHFSVVQHRDR